MKDKVVALDQAAESIPDGSFLGLPLAQTENAPMSFLRAVLRRGVKNLRVATLPGGGMNIDLLIGAQRVVEYETCYCSLGEYGQAPNFQRALRSGALKMKDST